jgi:hypothetical protein
VRDCDSRHESLIMLSHSVMVRRSHLLARCYLGTMCMCTTKLSGPNSMNYIKDQDHHWVFHIAFHFLNTSSLCLDAFYIYQKFMSSYTLNFLIANSIEPKIAKFRCLVILNLGPSRILGSPTRWRINSTFKSSNSKLPQNNLAPRAKLAKFRCLVIWNRGPGWIMRSPTHWGSNSTFKAWNQKHPPKHFALCNKTTKFKCLVIWNWILTSTAWCCNLCANQLDLQKESQNNHVNWNYNIHVTYNMYFCKHQLPCEEYKLELFALNKSQFLRALPEMREEKKGREMSHCEPYILYRSPCIVWVDYWCGCWLRSTWVSSYKWLLICKFVGVAWRLDVTIN